MQRMNLKLAIVAAEKRHHQLAVETNAHLPLECHLSELDISKIVTNRKNPNSKQAAALACVLGRSVVELFPEVKA